MDKSFDICNSKQILESMSVSIAAHLLGCFLIGKKVEVSLRLFDVFERNMVFIFLWENLGTHPAE